MIHRLTLAAIAALLFVGAPAHGQVVFDNDSADGTWENALNWSGDALPGAGDNVQVHSGLMATLSSNQSVADFTVGSDGAGGTTGQVDHTAGTLSGAGTSWAKVGTDGAGNIGTYNMSGSASLANFDVFALGIVGGDGTLNMGAGTSLSTNSGVAMGGIATVNQTGGTFTSGAWIGLSNFGGGTVNYNISGGSVISNGDVFTVGEDGVGNLNVSGTANVEANGIVMTLGRNGGSDGTLNVDGSGATISVNDLIVDESGNSGAINWVADAGGITQITSANGTRFGDNGNLTVDLTADSGFANFGTGSSSLEIMLIENVAGGVAGTFNGLAEGASVDIGGGKTAILSYIGGDGNDITLTVQTIPEPGSMAVIAVGLGVAAFRRRRR